MDLGLRGRHALVCGASRGLGRACAEALAREGCSLTVVARDAARLEAAAQEMRSATGATVIPVAADITVQEGRALALAACAQPDIVVTNAGGPPAGDFRRFTRQDWMAAVDANMLAPIELMRATLEGMIARRFGRIVNITTGALKLPLGVLGLSTASRCGLTAYVAGVSREVAQHNVTINNMLPGFFLTERSRITMTAIGAREGKTYEETIASRLSHIPAHRPGRPAEFGDACAWLCSVQAGYITGQNLLIDGGVYPGLF